MPEELEGLLAERALLLVDDEALLCEAAEQFAEMLTVLLGRAAGDEDVVEVHEHEGNVAQDGVHEALKCLGRVLQAKGHPQELKQAEWRDDRRLWDVLLAHRDLVVAAHQIDLAEDSTATEVGREVLDVRHRVLIRCGDVVESAEITTGPESAVWLLNDY